MESFSSTWKSEGVLDDRVKEVLARLEEQDRVEREQGLPVLKRAPQGSPTTGR